MKKILSSILTIGILAGIGSAVGFAIAFTHPVDAQVVYQSKEVIVEVERNAPVLERIANCESGNKQFKDGQVLISINKNGTYDQGIMQINSIHNKDASNRGYNLATEEGNKGYGKFLYENYGTSDWSASQACWRK